MDGAVLPLRPEILTSSLKPQLPPSSKHLGSVTEALVAVLGKRRTSYLDC